MSSTGSGGKFSRNHRNRIFSLLRENLVLRPEPFEPLVFMTPALHLEIDTYPKNTDFDVATVLIWH